jgi:hypothetical protein
MRRWVLLPDIAVHRTIHSMPLRILLPIRRVQPRRHVLPLHYIAAGTVLFRRLREYYRPAVPSWDVQPRQRLRVCDVSRWVLLSDRVVLVPATAVQRDHDATR